MKTFSLTATRSACLSATFAAALFASCATTTHSDMSSSDKSHSHAGGAQDHGAMPQLPPGWTEADMQACMLAGTPGPMHQHLARSAGTWSGTNTMWMAPGMPEMTSTCTDTVTMEFDGRYAKAEFRGEIPGMGPFHGIGYSGFDNVSQKFVGTWMDNHGTGIMTGTGTLSSDGKTLTWSYTYNCPMRKGPAIMRQVETYTGDDAMTLEMFGNDPKSGVEYKMMRIDLKRTSKARVGA